MVLALLINNMRKEEFNMKKQLMKKASSGSRGYVMGKCSCPCSCSVDIEYNTAYQVVHYLFIL
jgi:hypothetical protein